jgi:hypothetical protein
MTRTPTDLLGETYYRTRSFALSHRNRGLLRRRSTLVGARTDHRGARHHYRRLERGFGPRGRRNAEMEGCPVGRVDRVPQPFINRWSRAPELAVRLALGLPGTVQLKRRTGRPHTRRRGYKPSSRRSARASSFVPGLLVSRAPVSRPCAMRYARRWQQTSLADQQLGLMGRRWPACRSPLEKGRLDRDHPLTGCIWCRTPGGNAAAHA